MSNKNVLKSFQMITNGDMSGSITSKPTNIQYLDNVAISLLFPVNAAATGTFFVDVSTDGITYTALDIAPAMSIPDADNSIQIEMNQLSASWVQVRYVRTSGTGTLNAFISAKEL